MITHVRNSPILTKTNFNQKNYKQMKKTIKTILTLTLVMGSVIMAHAQKTITAPASATILNNLTIALDEAQNEIAFGTLSQTTPAGVVLDANGVTNVNTGTVTNVTRFDLKGSNDAVTLSYDATVELSNTDETPATMTMTPQVVGAELDTDQATATAVTTAASKVTLASGVYFLWVGGTIPALSAQATGTYSGTFNIDVEYN